MHAVLVKVTFNDVEAAEAMLTNDVVPMVKQAPGFVAGWWTRSQDRANGMGLVVWESEEAAEQARERLQSGGPGEDDSINLESIEIREVVASA
jgi:heme-degrading monooxygenase HmoA